MADGFTTAARNTYHDAGWAAIAATPFVSLHSGDPGTTGANECSSNGYSRQACSIGSSTGGVKQNATAITFGPAATADWSILYYALWTAQTDGTFLGYWTLKDVNGDPLLVAAAVPVDSVAKFAAGELKFTIADAA